MAELPDEVRAVLRDIVHSAIDTGAFCQRYDTFVEAEPGIPIRSVYDGQVERAVAALLMVWPVHVDTFLHPEPKRDDLPGEEDVG